MTKEDDKWNKPCEFLFCCQVVKAPYLKYQSQSSDSELLKPVLPFDQPKNNGCAYSIAG